MRKRAFILLVILVVSVGLDQATKLAIDKNFHLFQSKSVIPELFNLTYVRNTGAAFGFLSHKPLGFRIPFFVGISLAAVAFILYFLYRLENDQILLTVALSLVLGGAIGNLIDRIRLGEVIDFLDIYFGRLHWPAFNIADIAITAGVLILLVEMVFRGQGIREKVEVEVEEEGE